MDLKEEVKWYENIYFDKNIYRNWHQVYNSNSVEARATILALIFAVELSATGDDGAETVGGGVASDFLLSDSSASFSEC